MIESWKKFFGTGWLHGQEPSKQDCFKAGYEAKERELVMPVITTGMAASKVVYCVESCIYSRSLNQDYPRKCKRCGKAEDVAKC